MRKTKAFMVGLEGETGAPKVVEIGHVCPTCGRKAPTPRGNAAVDKKWKEDVAKAEAAIAVLERAKVDYFPLDAKKDAVVIAKMQGLLAEACKDEVARLRRAVNEPGKLWAIYRRRDKAAGYAGTTVGGPETIKRAA